jgi:hypothetical protein
VIEDSQGSALWGLTYSSTSLTAHVLSHSMFGDLNGDGAFDLSDWAVLISGAHTSLAGLSPAEAYARGDLNLDGANDFHDFRLFEDEYIAVHGVAAFAELTARVSEPSASVLAVAAMLVGCLRRHAIVPSF